MRLFLSILLALAGLASLWGVTRAGDVETSPLLAPAPARTGSGLPPAVAESDQSTAAITYDILYVRAPRFGDSTLSRWNDTLDPWTPDAGSELVLWHYDTGQHEVIFPLQSHIDAGLTDSPSLGVGAVADPSISYDGKWVVFAYFHDVTQANYQRSDLSYAGADIYKINLETRAVTRLTFQEFTPNTGNGATYSGNGSAAFGSNPRVGVFNTGPAWLPNPAGLQAGPGRIIFTSTRDNFQSSQQGPGDRVAQLYVMDNDGTNVEPIARFSLARALHPVVLKDGRVIFTSWENQGMRVMQQFPLWQIRPDGTGWMSISGAFEQSMGHHFHTQTSDGNVVVTVYYNLNNNGFGELIKFPAEVPGPDFWGVQGKPSGDRAGIPFEHKGSVRLTPFTTGADTPSPILDDGSYAGKFTHPAGAPNNDLLVVWTPGPANHRNGVLTPTYDGGIYLIPNSDVITHPNQLVPVFPNDPNYNEQWPRPVVPYSAIYGVNQPAVLPWLRNEGQNHSSLEAGTPFALIGTSSVTWRETNPKDGDPFNLPQSGNYYYRWLHQGTDTSLYSDDEIYALRIVLLEPLTDRSYSNGLNPQFWSWGEERMRILGEFPLRKAADPTDTSFLAKVPANTPFTFQALDAQGRTLFTAQTWHSLRPGEVRTDCGGCHAHSKDPIPFASTIAGRPGYTPIDLTQNTPLLALDENTGTTTFITDTDRTYDIEYFRDIYPIFQAKCVICHSDPPLTSTYTFTDVMNLDLNADDENVWVPWQNWPGTYYRLVKDGGAQFGRKPMNPYGQWFVPQATRYIRPFQSRQSLLAWKIWGARLDGRSNADRPTESVPGDPSTFPPGADPAYADLDFIGTIMPPPSSGVPPLTYAEKLKITRWIDLGAPIHLDPDNPNHPRGYFADDLRPTLTLGPAVADAEAALKVDFLRVGAYDLESGIDPNSLVVTATRTLFGVPPGQNIAERIPINNGQVLGAPIPEQISLTQGDLVVYVAVKDQAGHVTQITRTYHQQPCYLADVTCDDRVDIRDVMAVAAALGSKAGQPGWNPLYDQDKDDDVDVADVQQVASDWQWALFP